MSGAAGQAHSLRRATGAPSLQRRTVLLIVAVILTNVSGNLLLSAGMKGSAATPVAALLNPFVAIGILLLILWTLSRMALLARADLSYVLPVTALGYLLNAVAGRWVLGESVSHERWAGAVLIVLGAALAGSTEPDTGTS
jgi:uncharacterized membrane protein